MVNPIGASTRIENAALTDAKIEWVDTPPTQNGKPTAYEEKRQDILNKLSKDRERSIEEIVGCREVLSLAYMQSEDLFLRLKHRLFSLENTFNILAVSPENQHINQNHK